MTNDLIDHKSRCGMVNDPITNRFGRAIIFTKGFEGNMTDKRATKLGQYLREAREKKGLSTRHLAESSGVSQGFIVKLELGQYVRMPRPDVLSAIADTLDLNLADIYAMADYPMAEALPAPMPFLRAKYPDLGAHELNALSREVAEVLKRHGIDPNGGPREREDEAPDADRLFGDVEGARR